MDRLCPGCLDKCSMAIPSSLACGNCSSRSFPAYAPELGGSRGVVRRRFVCRSTGCRSSTFPEIEMCSGCDQVIIYNAIHSNFLDNRVAMGFSGAGKACDACGETRVLVMRSGGGTHACLPCYKKMNRTIDYLVKSGIIRQSL